MGGGGGLAQVGAGDTSEARLLPSQSGFCLGRFPLRPSGDASDPSCMAGGRGAGRPPRAQPSRRPPRTAVSPTGCSRGRVVGAARGGAKALKGREGPRGVASRRRSQGRPVIPRGRAKARRGPRGGARGARGLREAARRGWSQGRSGAEGRGHGRSRGAGPVPPERGLPPVTVVRTRGGRGRSGV